MENSSDTNSLVFFAEAKLNKLKSDPNVLRNLTAKREACMQQLLSGEIQLPEDSSLEAPLANSALLRTVFPHKQGLIQAEVVEFVKYDELKNEDCEKDQETNTTNT